MNFFKSLMDKNDNPAVIYCPGSKSVSWKAVFYESGKGLRRPGRQKFSAFGFSGKTHFLPVSHIGKRLERIAPLGIAVGEKTIYPVGDNFIVFADR